MQGWIIDAYADYDKDSLVLWLWTEQGVHRIEDARIRPSFFIGAPPNRLQEYRHRLEIMDDVSEIRETRRRLGLIDCNPSPVLEIFPRHYRDLNKIAKIIDSNGGYYDHTLYNIDLRFSQRYFLHHGIFPMGLVDYSNGIWRMQEEQFALEYKIPPLHAALLDISVDNPMGIPRFQDRLLGARLGDIEIGGSEGEILGKLNTAIRDMDPDMILTDGGDSFVMPYLAKKSEALGIDLQLGRDPQKLGEKKGKSYFTYGRIVYKPGQYLIKGRLHIDRGHFAYREGDMAGLVELSRLSRLVPQEQARLTPGTAFTAMQINRAIEDGVLVMWKKNLPEFFKDAEHLIRADRGGFILEPEVGAHENIIELDYASMYPNIMVKFNLSMETLNCKCCVNGVGQSVPGLGYHSCVRQVGLVPRVLRPLIDRKRYYKKLKKDNGPNQEIYKGRDTVLKWTLVTCLEGNTMIPHYSRGGYRIAPIRDIIDPILPDGGTCDSIDDLTVFSIDEDYKAVERRVARFVKARAPPKMLSLSFSRGRQVVVTPNHRFYVLGRSGLEVVIAADLCEGHRVPIVRRLPFKRERVIEASIKREGPMALEDRIGGEDKRTFEHLRKISQAEITFVKVKKIEEIDSTDGWVYCFEVDGEPNAFVCNGNLIVGNSFGYQGFKNARFGRIECHESINAYARELLVRSMEIAEQHGYEVVHGIVDSLWLRPKPNASNVEKLIEHINGAIGIPIDLEGVYKWIVFLPCKTTGVGALNRYYGLFQDGEMKLRGIELRKHDTAPFVNEAQKAMLNELSHANNTKEFVERLPTAIAVLQAFSQRLRDGMVPLQDLVLTKAVTRQLDEYTVMTNSVAALKQMKSRGYSVEPGEYIRFVITDGQSKDSEKKVKAADFIQRDERPDVNEYLRLLCRAGETLLLPFGYSEERLLEICGRSSAMSESTPAIAPPKNEVTIRRGPGYIPARH